ncbi:MAG: hypothetical protein L3J39_08885 [Verrucomicrobiales bacterium]|nr:hypothetical protein [Verrucomicrobiales bacterium]
MHKSILASFLFLIFAVLTTFAHASDTRQDQQTLYLAQKRAAYWKSKGYHFDARYMSVAMMDQRAKAIQRAAYWKSKGYHFNPAILTAGMMDRKIRDQSRAAYWQRRGYYFDAHSMTAAEMDIRAQKMQSNSRTKFTLQILNRKKRSKKPSTITRPSLAKLSSPRNKTSLRTAPPAPIVSKTTKSIIPTRYSSYPSASNYAGYASLPSVSSESASSTQQNDTEPALTALPAFSYSRRDSNTQCNDGSQINVTHISDDFTTTQVTKSGKTTTYNTFRFDDDYSTTTGSDGSRSTVNRYSDDQSTTQVTKDGRTTTYNTFRYGDDYSTTSSSDGLNCSTFQYGTKPSVSSRTSRSHKLLSPLPLDGISHPLNRLNHSDSSSSSHHHTNSLGGLNLAPPLFANPLH